MIIRCPSCGSEREIDRINTVYRCSFCSASLYAGATGAAVPVYAAGRKGHVAGGFVSAFLQDRGYAASELRSIAVERVDIPLGMARDKAPVNLDPGKLSLPVSFQPFTGTLTLSGIAEGETLGGLAAGTEHIILYPFNLISGDFHSKEVLFIQDDVTGRIFSGDFPDRKGSRKISRLNRLFSALIIFSTAAAVLFPSDNPILWALLPAAILFSAAAARIRA